MASKRRPKPSMTPEPEKWTWQMAEEALTKNASNRRVRENDVDRYARDMKKKLWGICDQAVTWDWDGNLINGQHRFLAQIKSKTTQYWYVLRDVPPDTKHHLDTGIPRNPADQLKDMGYANTIVLTSVARWSFLLEQGAIGSARVKPSTEEILDMVRRHPDLPHSAQMGQYARGGFVQLNPTPVGAAQWWIAQHNDHSMADEFIERFVHMNREQDGSPILALMARLNKARQDHVHVNTRVQIAAMVRAWNMDLEGRFTERFELRSKSGEFKMPDVLVAEAEADETEQPDEGQESA